MRIDLEYPELYCDEVKKSQEVTESQCVELFEIIFGHQPTTKEIARPNAFCHATIVAKWQIRNHVFLCLIDAIRGNYRAERMAIVAVILQKYTAFF